MIDYELIARICCEACEIERREVYGVQARRTDRAILARSCAVFLCVEFGETFVDTSDYLGLTDHTSALNLYRWFVREGARRPGLSRLIIGIRRRYLAMTSTPEPAL
jgi:chromosomal replication initiation ATPase DnaA